MKFPVIYGTEMFITMFTRARLSLISRAKLIQSTKYFLMIHFDIILRSASRYGKRPNCVTELLYAFLSPGILYAQLIFLNLKSTMISSVLQPE
jgi:hypothetical protein